MGTEGKKSFVLYTEMIKDLEDLSFEEKGKIFHAICEYESNGEIPDFIESDRVLKIAFTFIRRQLDRDNEKWEKTIEARRSAGEKGGLAKASKFSKAKQELANVAVNVNEDVNVNVKGEGEEKKEIEPPPLLNNFVSEIKEIFKTEGVTNLKIPVEAEKHLKAIEGSGGGEIFIQHLRKSLKSSKYRNKLLTAYGLLNFLERYPKIKEEFTTAKSHPARDYVPIKLTPEQLEASKKAREEASRNLKRILARKTDPPVENQLNQIKTVFPDLELQGASSNAN
jgi:hypothetical protein